MQHFDVVIVGGGPGGITTALSARNTYPDKSILLIRREERPMIPCGIPYTLHSLESVDENVAPDAPLIQNGIERLVTEVVEISDSRLVLANGETVAWERLVLATGSTPILPPIPGVEKEGVFTISKRAEEIERLRAAVEAASSVVVIGGGFIGIEAADELLRKGRRVTLVEREDDLLPTTMDKEFGEEVRSILSARGARIITGDTVAEITGSAKTTGVRLAGGASVEADVVIVSVGYRPNLELARKMGLDVHPRFGIKANEFMRTSAPGVFAVGDVAAKHHFLTGDFSPLMLASTAMAQGRLVGTNLYDVKVLKGFGGVLGTFSTKIGDTAFASTGLTEKQAKALGIEYVVGEFETMDKHPGKLPGSHKQKVKLLFSRCNHVLIGAQIRGGVSVGEMINMLALLVQTHTTDMNMNTMQIGTHPLLTASPIVYPVINATVNAILKWDKS